MVAAVARPGPVAGRPLGARWRSSPAGSPSGRSTGSTASSPGSCAGEVTLLSDPAPRFDGVRVDVRWGGRRLEARAEGVAADALRPRLAGEVVSLRGTVRPVEPGQPWLVARHIGGELHGAPGRRLARRAIRASRARQRAPPHARRRRRATRRARRGRSSRAWSSATTASSPPTSPTPSGAPGSPTCSRCPGRTWPSPWRWPDPLLRRLRLWPRLVVDPRGDRAVRADDPVRAVGAARVGDGRAGRHAGDAGPARSRGCGSSGSPSPRCCWSIRCSCARSASSCRSARPIAIVVLAPRLAVGAARPGAVREARRGDPRRPARRGAGAAGDLRPDPGGVAAGQPPRRPGRRARDGVGPDAGLVAGRGRRRRGAALLHQPTRLALGVAGARRRAHRPRAARRARALAQVVALAVGLGGLVCLPSPGLRRTAGAALAVARGAAAVVAAHAPAPLREALASGRGPLARRRGRRGRARRRRGPVEPRRRPACSRRCAGRASARSTCWWSPTRRCPRGGRARASAPTRSARCTDAGGRCRRRSSSARWWSGSSPVPGPAGRRRRAPRAHDGPARGRGRFGARGSGALAGGVGGAVPHRRARARTASTCATARS